MWYLCILKYIGVKKDAEIPTLDFHPEIARNNIFLILECSARFFLYLFLIFSYLLSQFFSPAVIFVVLHSMTEHILYIFIYSHYRGFVNSEDFHRRSSVLAKSLSSWSPHYWKLPFHCQTITNMARAATTGICPLGCRLLIQLIFTSQP